MKRVLDDCRFRFRGGARYSGGPQGDHVVGRVRDERSDSPHRTEYHHGVQAIHEVPAPFVATQIDSVLSDIGADAVKTGMLLNAEIVRVVAPVQASIIFAGLWWILSWLQRAGTSF